MAMNKQAPLKSHSDEVAEIACAIAGSEAIGTVYLSLPERPSYQELSHLRQRAEGRNLSVSLIGDSLTIRPLTIPALTDVDEQHPHATAIWLHRHFGPWVAELRSMSEGTR
jgi:hypothetical protein